MFIWCTLRNVSYCPDQQQYSNIQVIKNLPAVQYRVDSHWKSPMLFSFWQCTPPNSELYLCT